MHREIQQRYGGNDAVELLILEGPKRAGKIEGVAVDEMHAVEMRLELLVEVGGVFDGNQLFRLYAALEDRLGDHPGAGAKLEDRQTGFWIDYAGHAACRDGGSREDRADRAGIAHPALEEADLFVEFPTEFFLHPQAQAHRIPSQYDLQLRSYRDSCGCVSAYS